MVINMYQQDFQENVKTEDMDTALSSEDKRFLQIVENDTKLIAGKYQVPLPFKRDEFQLTNNYKQAFRRFSYLEKKFSKDENYKTLYAKAMSEMFEKGYAEKGTTGESGKNWYVSHHGVTHPLKPNKLRVVFDASAEYQNDCINRELLKGPDLTNQLIGVLMQFRSEEIAITADIEGMFFQVKIPPEQRSYFKFLWYEDANTRENICEYQMTSHIFGATSSPSCSNYSLRKTAIDNADKYDEIVINAVLQNFYVDDFLISVPVDINAENFVSNIKDLCRQGGFNLTKFNSNYPAVLSSLPEECRKSVATEKELPSEMPQQSTLGIRWNTTEDTLSFKFNNTERPLTKRGILSVISAVYDPLGLIGPFILPGRQIYQTLCRLDTKWDDQLTGDIVEEWLTWKQELEKITDIKLPRCQKPPNFGKITNVSLHAFSDASEKGHGIACYLRYANEDIACSMRDLV